jgi:virulence-associated protein VapD
MFNFENRLGNVYRRVDDLSTVSRITNTRVIITNLSDFYKPVQDKGDYRVMEEFSKMETELESVLDSPNNVHNSQSVNGAISKPMASLKL